MQRLSLPVWRPSSRGCGLLRTISRRRGTGAWCCIATVVSVQCSADIDVFSSNASPERRGNGLTGNTPEFARKIPGPVSATAIFLLD